MTSQARQQATQSAAQIDVARGMYFEDHVGLYKAETVLLHATPRTVTDGDVAVYNALFGQRFAVTSDDTFAQSIGFERAPIPWMLLFHIGFGKTVPDISQLAVANLGYADVRFLRHVYPGDSLAAESRIIGYKENLELDKATGAKRSRGSGNTYVQSVVYRLTKNGREPVLSYRRVVMVNKRDRSSTPAKDLGLPESVVPDMPQAVEPRVLQEIASTYPDCAAANRELAATNLAGSSLDWESYQPGMRINHGERRQITSAHMELPNLTQNTAKVHFAEGRVDETMPVQASGIVYGGQIMSMADAQSFYGLENTLGVVAINGGRHVAPCFEGESIAAWSLVTNKLEVPNRPDVGLLTVRTLAAKNMPAGSFPDKDAAGRYPSTAVTITINGHKHSADATIVLDYERVLLVRRGISKAH
ncbi:MAG: MaoC family dehydratase [Hyphomicrobiaceae bacterium]